MVGSSSSRSSGSRNSSPASASATDSPPESVSTVRSSRTSGRPSRSSVARARSSMSHRSSTASICDASPASTARIAATVSAMPSTSSTRRLDRSATCCGRYATAPSTTAVPRDGVSSPAMRRSSVDLPAPLTPMRPVRPGPSDRSSPSRTAEPSGHEKVRSEQQIDGMGNPQCSRRAMTRTHRTPPAAGRGITSGHADERTHVN